MRTRILLGLLLLTPVCARAEFSLSFGSWNYGVSGTVADAGSEYDLERDLGVAARERSFYHLAWDSPKGLPDLALNYSPIRAGGSRVARGERTLGGVTLGGSDTTVSGDADIQDYDLSLRYPWMLGRTRLNLGLVVKRLDGEVRVRDDGDELAVNQAVDETFPMAQLEAQLPLTTGLRLELLGNHVSYDGNSATELRAQLRALVGPLGLSVGWQRKDYELQGERFDLDAQLDGGFVSFGLLIR